MVLLDGLMRLRPGALGDEESASSDSFSAQGQGLLHCPQYTRPAQFDEQGEQQVPDVLLSGDHQRIARWRMKQSLGATWRKRPDLLAECELSSEQRALLDEYKREFEASQG
jgi:tRNA (guanine37-N1)-methyltransferase